MRLLTAPEVHASLESQDPESLFLDPLLRPEQVGAVSVDLRLGYDFLVSVLTRQAAIEVLPLPDARGRSVRSFFQETRRQLGERFVLYPHQTVLTTTLEYLSLPGAMLAEVGVRSSYSRLGIGATTVMQPGWRGTIPLEVFNHGNTPVEMVVGSCVFQARFFSLDVAQRYTDRPRKYYGTVRPTPSRIQEDVDLKRLARIPRTT